MSKPRISIDSGYFFIFSLLLFLFNASLITVFLAIDFKNKDLSSYFFASAGALLTIKTYITSYANATFAIRDNRYYTIITNIVVGVFQFVCVFLALLWLKEDSYPQVTAGYFFIASVGLIAQIVIGKLTSSIQYQAASVLYYALIFTLLYTKTFNADIRFIQIISFVSVALELVLLLNLYRAFQLKEVVTVKQLVKA